MSNHMKTIAMVSALVAGVATAPTLYAHDPGSANPRDSMMHTGMSGQGGMMGGTRQMMETCREMMKSMTGGQGSVKPNEQWLRDTPASPERKG